MHLVLKLVPPLLAISEIERRERETEFSKELVSTKSVPVPDTQPKGTRAQLFLFNLSLKSQRKTKQLNFFAHSFIKHK